MSNLQAINYQAWDADAFKEPNTMKEKLRFVASCGLLAPSVHNTQPWKFDISQSQLTVTVQHQLQLPIADKSGQGLFLSIGCCLFNMEVAANRLGFQLCYTIDSNKPVKVVVGLIKKKTKPFFSNDLFETIFKRWSDKGLYLSKPVPTHLLTEIQSFSKHFRGISTTLVDDKKLKTEVTELYLEAASRVSLNKKFGTEISHWVRANTTKKFDGMPGFVNGLPLLLSLVSPYVLKLSQKPLKIQAQADYQKLKSSPVVGFLSSTDQSVASWIETGRAYELLHLFVTVNGLSCAPMAAIVEDDQTSQKLLALTKKNNRFIPHIFFRLGYSNNQEVHTPRRPLEYCLS